MLINLVADRFRGLKSKGTPLSQSAIENPKSKIRTVFPETGAMRREEKIAASVPGQHATADVCLKLADGEYTVLSPRDRHALLVNA